MSRALLLLFSLALASTQVFADEGTDRDAADLARAQELRAQAGTAYGEIDKDRKAGEVVCAKKFLVNRCLDQLRDQLNKREREAKGMQVEAGKLERGVKARGVATKEAERESNRPERQKQQTEQGTQYKADQAQRNADLAKRQAEHDKAIAEGPARAQQSMADRVAKDAALAKKREADAAAAAARAKQAQEDKARYDEKRRKLEEKKASRPAAASAPALPPLIEQGADAPHGAGAPPPPPAATDMPPPPPPPPAN